LVFSFFTDTRNLPPQFTIIYYDYYSTIILQTSKEFELVLDPFMGSETTGRVCDNLERSFVGYDLKIYG